MITYYLYRLINSLLFDKCGATNEWDNRCRKNREKHGPQCTITILETMEGPNTPEFWQVVGDREWELADKYGYPRGQHYRHAREQRLEMNSRGAISGGLVGGAATRDSGKLLIAAKLGGKATRTTTFEIAQEIRSKYIPKKYTYGMIAEEYGVSVYTVINIVKRRSYLEP
tara:strand:- start:659 stop:1168 length:510 start_codon:yes stop_codon:yes gene_type:complete